jgi:hypothetical protein
MQRKIRLETMKKRRKLKDRSKTSGTCNETTERKHSFLTLECAEAMRADSRVMASEVYRDFHREGRRTIPEIKVQSRMRLPWVI